MDILVMAVIMGTLYFFVALALLVMKVAIVAILVIWILEILGVIER
jgi:hypothetical protein